MTVGVEHDDLGLGLQFGEEPLHLVAEPRRVFAREADLQGPSPIVFVTADAAFGIT